MGDRCDRLTDHVMTTEAWLAQHRDHGDLSEDSFPHPSGKWRTLVCECGARHVTDTPGTEVRRHG